ncbi:hypothetical protein K461DRAFT_310256, partial [Myriangium duriaei CBS 260.36]
MSYSYRGRGGSRATSSTVCQKCLQKGHYSYECKSALQERPYQSRPSRSQQLLNPCLRQTLTNQAPPEPQQSKGLADAILERSAGERRNKRSSEQRDEEARIHRRSLSTSSHSSYDSVSTISTNRSPSRSRTPPAKERVFQGTQDLSRRSSGTKRRRSRSPSTSWEAAAMDHDGPSRGAERHTRHRRRSSSPKQRGRRQERSPSLDRAQFSHPHTQSPSKSRDTPDGYVRRAGHHRPVRDPRERDRLRSPSPYSKRIALTRG